MAASEKQIATDTGIQDADKPVLEAFLAHAKVEAQGMTVEKLKAVETPETFCWVQLPKLNMSLTAYELTENPEHLRNFQAGFANLRSIMVEGPDGLLGWWGKPIPSLVDPAKADVKTNEIQTDFRAIGLLARFVTLAKGQPEFEATSKEYLALIENHLLKKWESYYSDLGDRGGVYRWNKDYIPLKANITLSHEKQAIMIEAMLNLYRATGKAEHRDRAAALGTFLKKSMKEVDGRYQWMFWDLGGDWDREGAKPDGKVRHWIGPEPQGVWYAATVGSAVMLYHHGLVFDEADIAKFRKTQMEVCWNGDLQKPAFKLVDGSAPKKDTERFVAPSLTPWEPTLAELLYAGAWQAERVAKAKDAWQGGVVAGEWLRGKYLVLPKAKDGKRLYAAQ
jgi:hypothetical protein